MEYSNEFLARVYGAYMGCDYQLEYDSVTTGERVVMYKNFSIFDLYMHYPENNPKTSKLLLLLTPLSAITDEHAIEVAKIEDKKCRYMVHNKAVDITDYKIIRSSLPEKEFVGVERYAGGRYMGYEPFASFRDGYTIEQIDYLRSQGYDCGYGDIPSQIEAGLAIDKTTLNN